MTGSAAWKRRGKRWNVGEFSLFCVDENHDAPHTILLLHGFPTSSFDWSGLWDDFANYRLVAPDFLGLGFSDKPYPHRYSIHQQADLIERLASEKNIETAHVLAHDYGDTVAQELLARQNEGTLAFRMQSVCFLNGGLFPETHRALAIQKLLLSPLGPLINRLTTKSQFDRSFSAVFGRKTKPTPEMLDELWTIINSGDGRHCFHSLITYMRDRKENRLRWIDAIKNSSIPVGLINGSADPVSGAHMVERFKELIGDPTYLKALPGIGHYPQLEASSSVAQAYQEFLGQIAA